jgi:dipeptidyl aminopeptidase/acylaminoacyl peptidase
VAAANALVLYRALKEQKVTVKLMIYRGIGHLADRPWVQRAMAEQSLAWFGKWIWEEDKPTPP